MRILGISAFYHDSAAALVDGRQDRCGGAGRALHAQEARCRLSAQARFAIACSRPASAAAELDHVVFYDKPFLKFERLLETYLAFAPRGFHIVPHGDAVWLREKLFQKSVLRDQLRKIDDSIDWETKACSSPSTI